MAIDSWVFPRGAVRSSMVAPPLPDTAQGRIPFVTIPLGPLPDPAPKRGQPLGPRIASASRNTGCAGSGRRPGSGSRLRCSAEGFTLATRNLRVISFVDGSFSGTATAELPFMPRRCRSGRKTMTRSWALSYESRWNHHPNSRYRTGRSPYRERTPRAKGETVPPQCRPCLDRCLLRRVQQPGDRLNE